ncbi:MAG: gamma-glutamyltransferase, partial [Burkholderiaceae bacterium]|nr:gamma-glutamyltransferase [Burkholderiaceae bacterium]
MRAACRRSAVRVRLLSAALALLLAACASPGPPSQPEPSSPLRAGSTPVLAQRQLAASANPLATEAGVEILRAGGSAVDAAIAIQLVLALVEPQSSGLGGGAFLLHWDGREVVALDGRETAPQAADERLFLTADGKPMAFTDAVVGGRAVGTPGAVRLLETAHRRYGVLPWPRLFEPAIRLSENGFAVSP